MVRTRPLLALTLPLALLACVVGHASAYALVGTSRADSAVHGYLAYGPLFLAACLSLVVVALGLRVAGRLRGRPSPWPLALTAPLTFLAQELIERLAVGLGPMAMLGPAVLVGLIVQLPLVLAAYALARWLLRAADMLALALAAHRITAFPAPLAAFPPATESLPRPIQAHAGFGRAPPQVRAL